MLYFETYNLKKNYNILDMYYEKNKMIKYE